MKTERSAFAITPSNDNPLPLPITKLYVGGAGDITLIMVKDSTEVVLKAVPVGTILNINIKQIKATGTGATHLVGFV